uniref:Uncharacterized protein n=1 Tax=Rhizophora mucronata TaxID=61149 RepID=A0A2P2QZ92_RHIMU
MILFFLTYYIVIITSGFSDN